MKLSHSLLAAATLALVSSAAISATTVYTDQASFLSNVATGAYTNSFTTIWSSAIYPAVINPVDPIQANYSAGSFSYNISDASTLQWDGSQDLSKFGDVPFVLTFTSGNVYAVGGNFYATTPLHIPTTATFTLTSDDGTVVHMSTSGLTGSFAGFSSTTPITTITMSIAAGGYQAVDNLTVGAATVPVPEPATYALMLLGIGAIGMTAHRKALKTR